MRRAGALSSGIGRTDEMKTLIKVSEDNKLLVPEGFTGSVRIRIDSPIGGRPKFDVDSTGHAERCQCPDCCPRSAEEAALSLYDECAAFIRSGEPDYEGMCHADILDRLAFALGRPNADALKKSFTGEA
jgi:hypothetical protein